MSRRLLTCLSILLAAPARAGGIPMGRTELTLPFQGRWLVAQGGTTLEQNYHGRHWDFARYAYDFVMVDETGRKHRGSGRRPADYVGYGQPILAPADGQVVRAVDGFPDQAMQAPPASDAPGNLVVIRHATGEVSELLHLQPGSVTVKTGQSVVRGQTIGRCGNSGYSHVPHLHYNLTRRQGRDVTCLLASFAWIRVQGPQGEIERRNWAPVRGEVVWPSSWSNRLHQPSARPFQVRHAPGRLILQQP